MSDKSSGSVDPAISKAQLFETIIESSTDFAIFTMDPTGTTTSWNIGAERLFGFTESEIIGSTADVIFTPEDRQKGAADQERSLARRDGRAIDERWHQRKDGSRFWASGLMMPLKEGPGFVKITRDRTEQRRANEQLRENEQRFRLLATSVPQLVFTTRHDGFRTWGSPQWIDFTGLSLENSLGSGWLDAIHPDDREGTVRAWQDAPAKGEYYAEQRIRRKRDQQYRWHQTRARPVNGKNPASNDWVGTMTDIHELRGLKDRQDVLMAELQHRTRNLLAVVQSVASQTARKSASLEVFKTEFESRLRALSRVQGLISRVDHRDIDLRTLICVELEAHGAVEGGGRIIVDGPTAELDPSSAQVLALALHELATNALKHGALGQPTGRLRVAWQLERKADETRLVLEWRETGVCMPSGKPTRRGYGSELIEKALPYQLMAKTNFAYGSDGVRCSISVPVQTSGPNEVEHD
jgi:PAS domain S-box-containing protein